MNKELVHYNGVDGHVCKTQRMARKTHISIQNFCVTNLFNFVLQKAGTGVNPHYFDVWPPTHHGNADVEVRLVSISFYSYTIFVMFILKSILCRTDIGRSSVGSTGQSYKTRGWSPSTLMLRMLQVEVPLMDGK
jgi:hypothetical protein